MKRLFLLIFSLLLVFACSKPSGEEQPSTPSLSFKKYAGEDEVKIMSFNVRTKTSSDEGVKHWDSRKEACVALIKDHKPTLIGFQEAQYESQWLYLKEQLADNYEGYGVSRQDGKESGTGETMGILYDKSVIEKIDGGTFWLSETPDKPSKGWDAAHYRTATWGIFKHIPTGEMIYYINTHLDNSGKEAQVGGMRLISQHFEEYRDTHDLFLTGDLNIYAANPALDVINGYMWNTRTYAPSALSDNFATYNGYTGSSNSIIDHIYCSKGMKVVEYHTIKERYNGIKYVSDHYPIYAIVKLK